MSKKAYARICERGADAHGKPRIRIRCPHCQRRHWLRPRLTGRCPNTGHDYIVSPPPTKGDNPMDEDPDERRARLTGGGRPEDRIEYGNPLARLRHAKSEGAYGDADEQTAPSVHQQHLARLRAHHQQDTEGDQQ
ncbi:hypothetical protein AB0L97_20215 [Nocardia sp. NPDC051911]|uniref:hypothetical protein n=1 Tax=Nocardia sp. NPDC051911 TaxID=3154648 RepID=UPI00343D69FA